MNDSEKNNGVTVQAQGGFGWFYRIFLPGPSYAFSSKLFLKKLRSYEIQS